MTTGHLKALMAKLNPRNEAGRVTLRDMGSRNGTFINGKRIEQGDVSIGDTVRFGNLTFAAEAPAADLAEPNTATAPQPDADNDLGGAPAGPSPTPISAPPQAPEPLADVPSLGSVISYGQPRPSQRVEAAAVAPTPAPWGRYAAYMATACGLVLLILVAHHALERRKQRRYDAEITQGLNHAEGLMRQGAWRRAEAAFETVLQREPLNGAAKRGRHQAELHLDYEAAMGSLAEPESPMYYGQVFVRLSALMADHEAATLGERPRTLLDQARRQLSQSCALEALGACRAQTFGRCRDEAVCAVLFDPDNMLGAALLDQALEAVPTPPLNDGPPGEAMRRRAALAARYPQPAVRAAVLAYATGDLNGALKRLRHLRGEGALQAAGPLWALGQAQKVGDAALARGNVAAAIRAFEEAVALDARLLPPGQPSVLGRSLLDRATNQWLREGERSFNRGRYGEALSAWQRGLQLDPAQRQILRAVERLEARAQQIFDAAAKVNRPTAEVCGQLREVQTMVRRDQPLYQATLDRLAACPTGTP
jgi:tetratricopeptide (TPR) repeat protein